MALPIKRTGQIAQPTLKALVIGPAGSGKTLFGSTWPDPLYLSAEAGLLVLQELDLPYLDIETSEDLNKARLALDQDRGVREKLVGFDVKTVILDTTDQVQQMLAKERMLEEHKEALAQGDWGWLLDQMRSITRGFRNLDLNVIFTCHTKEDVDQESGRRTVHPLLQGQYANEISSAFDLAVLLRANPKTEIEDGRAKRTTERFLQTYPDANHDWVKDRSGKLPPEFRLNFVDDYDRMAKLIFGDGAVDSPRNQRLSVPGAQTTAASSADLKAAKAEKTAQKTAEKPAKAPQKAKESPPEPTTEAGAQEPDGSAEPAPEPAPEPVPEPEPQKGPDAGAMQAQAMDEAHAASQEAKAEKAEETKAEEPAPEPEAADESEKAPPKPARTPTKRAPAKAADKPKAAEPKEEAKAEEETGSEGDTPEGPVCAECNTPYEDTKQLSNLQKLFKKPLCPTCAATCEICGDKVDDLQKVEFSGIRYRRRLCTPHFQDAGAKKKSA